MIENYVEINTDNINFNIDNIVKKYNNYDYYIAVVKGNAYGHGLELANYIKNIKINYYAVSTLEEALKLRKYEKEKPILILHPVNIDEINTCINNNLTITITNYNFYKDLINKDIKKELKIHLKINTGMNRLGIDNKDEITEIYNNLINNKHLILEGIYTHMATLGITDKNWDNQINTFINLTKDIDLNKIKIRHIYSSNSLFFHPKKDFCNGVRLGQIIYGNHFPKINHDGFKNKLKDIKRNYIRKKYNLSDLNTDYNLELKDAFTLISKVIEIKNIKKGSSIGYDAAYITNNDCKIATIPIGYVDGLNNSFKYVSINNNKYKIIGEINMCMTNILIDDKVNLNDKVILFGDNVITKNDINLPTPYLYSKIPENIKKIYKKN